MHNQAGTQRLKKKMLKSIEDAKQKAKQISGRIRSDIELSEEAKLIFYSNWFYSAIRNLTAVPQFQNAEAIAQRLGLPREIAQSAIEFLVERGLCKYENGLLQVGPQRTYVKADSPLVQQHHKNWRLQGFSKMGLKKSDDLFLTVPMSLSVEDAERIKTMLPAWFEEINKIIAPSPSETVRCLNIDFFEY